MCFIDRCDPELTQPAILRNRSQDFHAVPAYDFLQFVADEDLRFKYEGKSRPKLQHFIDAESPIHNCIHNCKRYRGDLTSYDSKHLIENLNDGPLHQPKQLLILFRVFLFMGATKEQSS